MKKLVMKNKSGLSAVVTNLIIILLVIVAVGIVWFVVNNLIGETTEGISLGKITLGMEIQNVVSNGTQINVTIQRSSGEGNLTAVKILVYDAGGDSESFEEISTLGELETQKFMLTSTITPTKVEIAPILTIKGKQKIGDIVDTWNA